MATKQPSRSAPTPRAFFDVACPRVLRTLRATCAALGGRYVVEIHGEGSWTIDFPTASVTPGHTNVADVVIHLSPKQFASLSTGKVELKKLTASGEARFEGNAGKIENIALLLAFLERG